MSEALDPFGYATHEVLNQPPPLVDYDAFDTDETLKTIVHTFGAHAWRARLGDAGRTVGSARVQELARQANRSPNCARTTGSGSASIASTFIRPGTS